MESSFQSSNITIHIEAPNDIRMLGFPNEYSQVLLNLLSNARDAILAHNSTIPGRVDIILKKIDGKGCVSVCDNGGGIREEILDKIFDPYFSTKEKGSGIGLYMSKMIIEQNMNGRITVKNLEAGTEFNICAPLAIDDPHEFSRSKFSRII
jgi:signal transduction histidine kinase